MQRGSPSARLGLQNALQAQIHSSRLASLRLSKNRLWVAGGCVAEPSPKQVNWTIRTYRNVSGGPFPGLIPAEE